MGKSYKRDYQDKLLWYSAIARWRDQWAVPRYVYLADYDNRLLLDLENPLHTDELLYILIKGATSKTICLEEALPGPSDAWIKGPNGHYLGEFVVPLVRKIGSITNKNIQEEEYTRRELIPKEKRVKGLGSDWLFFKLYIPKSRQNEVIINALYQLVTHIKRLQLTQRWFFIRYRDPEPHLRLRFQGSPKLLIEQLLPIINHWARDLQIHGLLQRLVIDAYDREIERYGGSDTMNAAEEIFEVDSEAVIKLLYLHEREQKFNVGLIELTTITIYDLLTRFGWSDERQRAWAHTVSKQHREFAKEYRLIRGKLLTFFNQYLASQSQREKNEELHDILKVRWSSLEHPLSILNTCKLEKKLWVPLEDIIESFVHMHCNRLFGISPEKELQAIVYLYHILSDFPKWREAHFTNQNLNS